MTTEHNWAATFMLLEVRVDNAGNVEAAPTGNGDDSTLYDTMPPASSASAPDYDNGGTIPVSWTANDAASGVASTALWYKFGAGVWTSSGLSQRGDAGAFNFVPGLGDGTYFFATVSVDNVGNVEAGPVEKAHTVYDTTRPQLGLTLSENSPYVHISGMTVYYGPYTDTFTAQAQVSDTLAGLETVVFPATVSPGGTYPQGGATQVSVSHVYAFDASSNFGNVAQVTVRDRAGNESAASFAVVRDATPPQVSVTAPSLVRDGRIVVTWNAMDSGSGLNSGALEARDGEGAWQPLASGSSGTYTYTGVAGHLYTFRVTATDNAGNNASAGTQSGVVSVRKYYAFGGKRVAMRTDSVVYYLHADHLGSTSLVTNQSQGVVSRQWYDPYGSLRGQVGASPTDFTFTAQRQDSYIKLIQMGARWYDPYLNRWISADTLVPSPGNPQSLNRYSYVLGNPLRYVDPTGHGEECGPTGHDKCESDPPLPPQPPTNNANDPLARYQQQPPPPEGRFIGLTSNDWSAITVIADGTSFLISVGGELAVASLVPFGLVDPPAGVTAEAFVIGLWFGFFKPAANVLTIASVGSTWASGVASGENTLKVENGSFYASVSQDLIVDTTLSGLQTQVPQPDGTMIVSGISTLYDVGRLDVTKPIFGMGPIGEGSLFGRTTMIPTLINPSIRIGPEGVRITLGGNR